MFLRIASVGLIVCLLVSASIAITPCTAPDNGSGTVDLPAPCPYIAPFEPLKIIDGLPAGTTIELDPTLDNFINIVPSSGGNLGGEIFQFDATLTLVLTGTGGFTGFNRTLFMPVHVEYHIAPRTPGDPVQSFEQVMVSMTGEVFGDPDFALLRFTAGTANSLPGPGQSTLKDIGGGNWNVDSFFDITYQIDFDGAPGSVLDGFSGSTTDDTRIQQGGGIWQPGDSFKMHFPQLPDEEGWDVNATYPVTLADDWVCSETGWVKDIHFWGSWLNEQKGVINSFTLSIHADVPAGVDQPYSHPGELLWEREITNWVEVQIDPQLMEGWYDPLIQAFIPGDHQQYFQYNVFLDSTQWFWQEQGTIYWLNITAHLENPDAFRWGWKSSIDHWNDDATWGMSTGQLCVAPDNGSGTVNLPAPCPYYAPKAPMKITDGLPAGATIEMDPIIDNYFYTSQIPGGTLGGDIHQFEATMQITVTGTGGLTGFNRILSVPIIAEIHNATRTPGDPVQSFQSQIFNLQGQLVGDPDFDQLIITYGTSHNLPNDGGHNLKQNTSGDWTVDSFFDITYEIEFVGAPGSILDGFSGTTIGNFQLQQGSFPPDFWMEMYEPPDFQQSLDLSFVITGESPTCCQNRGNVDGIIGGGGPIDVSDLTYLVAFLFQGGPPPPCEEEGNVDGIVGGGGPIDVSDLTYLVAFLFQGGPPPPPC